MEITITAGFQRATYRVDGDELRPPRIGELTAGDSITVTVDPHGAISYHVSKA